MAAIIPLSIRTTWGSFNHNMEVTVEATEVAADTVVEVAVDTASHTNKTSSVTPIRNIRRNYVDIFNNQDHAL